MSRHLQHAMAALRQKSREAGQALILAVLCLTAVLGFVGLSIDVGVLRNSRILLQTAADSAAIAGAAEVKYNDVTTAAQNDAMKNGLMLGPDAAEGTLVVNNPPLGGPHAADSSYVEVIASRRVPTGFMSLFGINSVTIKARAVAGLARIMHELEDKKGLFCYKHVVKTLFAGAKEASECLTIAQHSVCCSQEFSVSLWLPNSISKRVAPTAGLCC